MSEEKKVYQVSVGTSKTYILDVLAPGIAAIGLWNRSEESSGVAFHSAGEDGWEVQDICVVDDDPEVADIEIDEHGKLLRTIGKTDEEQAVARSIRRLDFEGEPQLLVPLLERLTDAHDTLAALHLDDGDLGLFLKKLHDELVARGILKLP